MFIDIMASLVVAAIVVGALVGFGVWVYRTQSGKIALTAVMVFMMLVCASGCLAETDTVTIVIDPIDMTVKANDGLLIITFPYEDDLLSFYWEGELEIAPMIVTVWNGIEVINADYIG